MLRFDPFFKKIFYTCYKMDYGFLVDVKPYGAQLLQSGNASTLYQVSNEELHMACPVHQQQP